MPWDYHNTVSYYETDRMGVVHHSNYLRFLEDARMAWIGENLMEYREIEALGIIVPAVSAHEEFKNYLHFGDHYCVRMRLVQYTSVRMSFDYEVFNEETGDLCLTATTTHYFSEDDQVTGRGYRPFSLKKKFPELHQRMTELLEPRAE